MGQKKQTDLPDINRLAEIFLETLKETKASGNLVNRKTFAQFLARKQSVKQLLKLAREGHNETVRTQKRRQLSEMIHTDSEQEPAKEQKLASRMVEAEIDLDKERDFQKRFTLFVMNLLREPYGDSIGPLMERIRQLELDGADLEEREKVFSELKNTMLRSDTPKAVVEDDSEVETADESEKSGKKSLFTRFVSKTLDIKVKVVKANILNALEELQRILGDEVRPKIEALMERVRSAEDIEYLISNRKQVVAIINEYVDSLRDEQTRLAAFIKDIGKKLIEIENDIIMTFAASNELLEDDSAFTERLGTQISHINDAIEGSDNLDQLKRIISDELSSLVAVLDERKREYDDRLEKNSKEKEKLQNYFQSMVSHVIAQNKQLVEQSQRDSLTGIYNRPTFEDMFERERIRFQRYQEPFTLIMFDIDLFKQVNDTYGHDAGDRVLRGVSQTTTKVLRKTDIFARFGGEEFIIMMPNTAIEEGGIAAEKIRKTIEDTEFIYESVVVPITISAGVSVITMDDTGFATIYNRVDNLLYRAKNAGRNTIVTDTD